MAVSAFIIISIVGSLHSTNICFVEKVEHVSLLICKQ